jgi:hypothetical protein
VYTANTYKTGVRCHLLFFITTCFSDLFVELVSFGRR